MLLSAFIHAAAFWFLAQLTDTQPKHKASVLLFVTESAMQDRHPDMFEDIAITSPASASNSAGKSTGQWSSPSDESIVAGLVELEEASGSVALAETSLIFHRALTPADTINSLPSDRLLDVVAPRRTKTAQTSVPKQSAADSPAAMAVAAMRNEPQWGVTAAEKAVYRFILYDIGHLRGQEAAEARAEYDALTPDTLPALIKGLNASAYLQASCPVIVLASRVQSMVTASNSKEAYDYAIRHIGEGVPPNAHYASRLLGLRQSLMNEAGRTTGAMANGKTAAMNNARSKHVVKLNRGSAATLARALSSKNADERWAAVRVVASRGLLLTDDLIPLLADEDSSIRSETHTALVRLGRGVDLGPENVMDDDSVEDSIDLWTRWWKQNRNRPGISEYSTRQDDESRQRRATSRLALADKLFREGLTNQAQRYYQEVVRDYPGTAAAKTAEERMQPNGP